MNLRPPRPERVSLSESSTLISNFDNVRSHRFTFGFVISVGKLSGRAEGIDRVLLVVRMMMTVHIDEGLLGHPEEPSRFPRSHATLREPRSAGMAQGMGDSHRDNLAAALRALSKAVFAWLMTS